MCDSLIFNWLGCWEVEGCTNTKASHANDLGLLYYSREQPTSAHGRSGLARETTLIQTQYEWTLGKCDHHVQTINNNSPFTYKVVRLDA